MRTIGAKTVVIGIGLAGAAATTLLALPTVAGALGYRLAAGGNVIQTLVTLVGALVAYLVWGRYTERHEFHALLLLESVVLLSLAHPLWEALAAFPNESSMGLEWWGSALIHLTAASLLLVSSLLLTVGTDRSRRSQRRKVAVRWLSVLLPLAIVIAGAFMLSAWSPEHVLFNPSSGWRANLTLSPLYDALKALTAIGFFLAARGLCRRADAMGDHFLKWAAIAALLSGFANINYILFPTVTTPWLYSGDLFEVASSLAWLVAGTREIAACRRALTQMATLDERRRIARDLHDGMAQELAYLATQTSLLVEDRSEADVATMRELAAAGQRALDESRRAIRALSKTQECSLAEDLARTAEEVARRAGTAVQVSVDPDLALDPARRETAVRIVREATQNAARHGGARQVAVELTTAGRGPRLRIYDDGSGFDVAAAAARQQGFGLVSMKERAQAAGADFVVRSLPGGGTTVEVMWPATTV